MDPTPDLTIRFRLFLRAMSMTSVQYSSGLLLISSEDDKNSTLQVGKAIERSGDRIRKVAAPYRERSMPTAFHTSTMYFPTV